MPAYRVAFNVFLVVALLPVLWLVYSTEGDWLWRWTGATAWVANGLALAALLCFFVSTRFYDMDEFLGLSQLKQHADDNQTFTLSVFTPLRPVSVVLLRLGTGLDARHERIAAGHGSSYHPLFSRRL